MLTHPEFHDQNCTRYRFRYSECAACADACPHDAIVLSDEGITISETACQNCALCTAVCPTEAPTAQNFPRVDILRRAIARQTVTFACAASGKEADEIVPCLGALDAVMLATLAQRGVEVTFAGTQLCSSCPKGKVAQRLLTRHLEAVEHLRQTMGNTNWAAIRVSTGEDAKMTHNASRRHLFRRFLGKPVNDMVEDTSDFGSQPAPMKAIRIAAPIRTTGRNLLQKLFDTTPDNAPVLPHHEGLFAAAIQLDSGCTACEACARVCPTGAINIGESAVSWALLFQFSRCVGCGVCVEVCQPRVLRFAEAMSELSDANKIVPLHARAKQRCNRCDRFFISAQPEEFCPVCVGDDADFADIFG
ncbi:MAG: 4Fe-4S dicluster domain-containing protein [Alphaproteobacteria bacterium]